MADSGSYKWPNTTAGVSSVSASSPLFSSGGTSPNLTIQVANTSQDGYLSSTDWNTFNNKQAAGNYITALTGDGTAAGPGSVALTLATVNSNVGSFGSASSVSAITVNAKGLVTAAASTSIQIAESQVTNLVSDLAGKQAIGNYITALTGDATASGPGSVALTLATVNGNVGSFGIASSVSSFTVNAKGLITAASNTSIQIAESQVTNLVSDLAGKQAAGNYITALTGDVTASGPGSAAATIANLAVTNAKIANSTIDLTAKVTGVLPIANGGTNNGSLGVTAGGVIYADGSKLVNTGAGTSKQYLKSNGASAPAFASFTAPSVQTFTSSTGTYTTPANVLYIKVKAVGGGGGGLGGGGGSSGGANGGNTTFGSSLLTANGGTLGGSGGTATVTTSGTVLQIVALTGGTGQGYGLNQINVSSEAVGGQGASSPYGGAGAGGAAGSAAVNAIANTGSGGGGGGGGNGVNNASGNGGGAGGYLEAIIVSPGASYSYAIGAAGTGGTAISGGNGSDGGSGFIEVTEYYQ